MKKIVHTGCLVLSIILLILGCGKDDSPTTPEEGSPDISSFSPTSGPVGTEIFITGKNFGSTVTSNTVKIGNTTATVSSASTTELFITVPNGAATGKVSVTVGGKTNTGGTFTVTQDEESNNVALSKTDIELFTLDSETLSFASGVDANTHVDWSSNDESVAIVDDNGKITGVAAGSTTITATVGDNEVEATVTIKPNVYVVGFESDGDTDVVKLWTNGIAEELPNAGDASSVFVNGADVYVAGQSSDDQAAIWKNGAISQLTNGANYAEARSVFVVGSDVYVAGNDDDGDSDVALVWKNGELLHELTDGTTSARAYSIFVVGSDTYVSGNESNEALKNVAKIWKNDVLLHTLSDEANNGDARSVFVDGSNVYAVGQEEIVNEYAAKIWKNGVATNLTDGTNYADARSVFVVDSDVYVVGLENTINGDTLIVWKNEQILYTLTDGSALADAHGIFVVGSDVYVAGHVDEGDNTVAKVWKNEEVLYELNNGSDLARAYSIFVK